MKPQFVEVIVAVAECGSIGAAAKKLGKSQPAITSALRNAEAELGERVFHRVPHGVVPTVLGKVVIDRCSRIDNEMKQLDEHLAQLKGDFAGTINVVAATTTASVRILPKALKQYRRLYPKIKINISAGRVSQGYHSLLSGEVDFIIGPMPLGAQTGGLKSVPLLKTRLVVISGANSKFANVSDPEILKTGNWLVNGPVEKRPRYWRFFEDRGITPPEPMLSAESLVTILALIEGSDDLCCMPEGVLQHLKGSSEFSILPLGDEIGPGTIALTSAMDRPYTRAAMLFSDIICQIASMEADKV